jgi:large subunit ribosomal protein L19
MRPVAHFLIERQALMHELIKAVQEPKRDLPDVQVGDTVRVYIRIVEGNAERVQPFQGTVIRERGKGNSRNFTVRRIATHGVGVERTFLMRSPRIEKIDILRRAKVRRAQLYYLRERRGKSARLKERRR